MMPRDDVAQPSAAVGALGRLTALLFQGMPLLFGVGFIAPLIAQLLERALPGAAQAGWPLVAGLVVGGAWGGLATLRGRWL